MKLLTFTWSVSIQAPDDFDSLNPSDMALALNDAWAVSKPKPKSQGGACPGAVFRN